MASQEWSRKQTESFEIEVLVSRIGDIVEVPPSHLQSLRSVISSTSY